MESDTQARLAFWREMAAGLGVGQPLARVLDNALRAIRGTALEGPIAGVLAAINKGGDDPLSTEMARQEGAFLAVELAMVRAGEVGGVLDQSARRLANSFQQGAFGPSSLAPPIKLWSGLAWLLGAGVPILVALETMGDEMPQGQWREAVSGVCQAVRQGKALDAALAGYPDLFPEPVRHAAGAGEQENQLDVMARRIATAISDNDLSSLTRQAEEMTRPTVPEDPAFAAARRQTNQLLLQAIKERASEIHLEPQQGGGGRVRLRVEGVLRQVATLTSAEYPTLIKRLKVMGNLDPEQRQVPQDAVISLGVNNQPIDLRLAVLPTWHGPRMTIRIANREAARLTLEQLKLSDRVLSQVRPMCHWPQGLVICTGPAGSGKTTLLYAMIMEIDRQKRAVISIEDPVIYDLPEVSQVQIQPQAGLTYARALRSAMRLAPDVLMLGEILDAETLRVAAQAVLNGHLLFTTLHTNSAPEAVTRLLDLGLEPFLVNAILGGVVAQRLVRVLCERCKQPTDVSDARLPAEARAWLSEQGGATFYAPSGCDACQQTGYRGRMAINEVLVMDDTVRHLVNQGGELAALRAAAVAGGMTPLLLDGLSKAAAGVTSFEEVLRVAGC